MSIPACFKAYDVRGRIPDELNEDLAFNIGRAYPKVVKGAKKVVVGRDIRPSSEAIVAALTEGLRSAGVDVLDVGLCGTETIYFATSYLNADGGVMVTASHNPSDYNGMKFVREQSKPISSETGLMDIGALAAKGPGEPAETTGSLEQVDIRDAYVEKLLSFVDLDTLKPLKIVSDPGHGCAGPVIDLLEKHLPFEFVKIHHNPDGSFPAGIPNPLLPENRAATANAVRESGADLGIAWDGDFDRCFFFDENGDFIEGYYLVGLLAKQLLADFPGGKAIYDPRLTWNTIEMVEEAGGVALQHRSGHAFIKERMRREDAVYGGEMSAHHYFRDFSYCDSGMIPWLLVVRALSETGMKLSDMVRDRQRRFPCSGEINSTVADAGETIARIKSHFGAEALDIDETDGVSLRFTDWRFNLRASNTEPVIRLNVESRGNEALLKEKTEAVLALIRND